MVVAVGKDQTKNLPRMGAADANIIRITRGNLPPRRHVHIHTAIFNKREIVDFVAMKRHVQVGAVALRKKRGIEGDVKLSARVRNGVRLQVCSCSNQSRHSRTPPQEKERHIPPTAQMQDHSQQL